MQNLLNSLIPLAQKGTEKVFVFCETNSARLAYTCEFIFTQVLKLNFELINDPKVYTSCNGIKINYSNNDNVQGFQIKPHGLLFQSSIKPIELILENQTKRCLFEINKNQNSKVELDVFSSVFYFISRYEEWQDYKPDKHGRFEAQHALLFKHNLHLTPIVDYWIADLKADLKKYFPYIHFPEKTFKTISTIDVDNVYAFKAKGIFRTLGAMAKDVIKFNLKQLLERTKVVLFNKKDPFDIYEDITKFCKDNQIPIIYFFLFKTGTQYDRTLNPNSNAFKQVFDKIKSLQGGIGIHPSYNAAFQDDLFEDELQKLRNKSNQNIVFSRQHFLRFNIKTSPHLLLKNGIKADFTMGFASSPGFRAGTSHPFYYYDLNQEQKTDLLMVPFCTMDGAYTVYTQTSASEAFDNLMFLAKQIKEVGGYFITVYHERSFYNHLYKEYGDLYKKIHLALK